MSQDMLGPIVRIDRSIHPTYPDWVERPMHPEITATGPAEYNLGNVVQWFHKEQKDGCVRGHEIYQHFKNAGDLRNHLDLRDLQVIQKLGIAVFRKHFTGKVVFGWGSVVLGRDDILRVPCLIESREVDLGWGWLDHVWYGNGPALRFRE